MRYFRGASSKACLERLEKQINFLVQNVSLPIVYGPTPCPIIPSHPKNQLNFTRDAPWLNIWRLMTLVRHLTRENITDEKPMLLRQLKFKNEFTNQVHFFICGRYFIKVLAWLEQQFDRKILDSKFWFANIYRTFRKNSYWLLASNNFREKPPS